MKKLFFAFMITGLSFAQTYVSLSADVRNAIIGSTPTNNKPEMDFILRAGVISNKGLKVGILFEKFDAIGFNKYGFEIGQRIGNEKLQLIPAVELGWIERCKMNSWTVGANTEILYFLNNNLGITATCNLSWRTDLNEMYGGNNWKFSNYIGLIYKFKKYGEL